MLSLSLCVFIFYFQKVTWCILKIWFRSVQLWILNGSNLQLPFSTSTSTYLYMPSIFFGIFCDLQIFVCPLTFCVPSFLPLLQGECSNLNRFSFGTVSHAIGERCVAHSIRVHPSINHHYHSSPVNDYSRRSKQQSIANEDAFRAPLHSTGRSQVHL